jgi:hypothetical protein
VVQPGPHLLTEHQCTLPAAAGGCKVSGWVGASPFACGGLCAVAPHTATQHPNRPLLQNIQRPYSSAQSPDLSCSCNSTCGRCPSIAHHKSSPQHTCMPSFRAAAALFASSRCTKASYLCPTTSMLHAAPATAAVTPVRVRWAAPVTGLVGLHPTHTGDHGVRMRDWYL